MNTWNHLNAFKVFVLRITIESLSSLPKIIIS